MCTWRQQKQQQQTFRTYLFSSQAVNDKCNLGKLSQDKLLVKAVIHYFWLKFHMIHLICTSIDQNIINIIYDVKFQPSASVQYTLITLKHNNLIYYEYCISAFSFRRYTRNYLNRGCPIQRCSKVLIPSRCKMPSFYYYDGRRCRGCYKNICPDVEPSYYPYTKFYWG